MFFISKKEISAYPFDKLFEFAHSKMSDLATQLKQDAKDVHFREVKRRLDVIYSSREDSYEGNIEEEYPFPGLDQALLDKELARVKKEAVSLFLEKYDVKANSSWMLPQIIAYIARMPITRNSDGKIDSMQFLANFGKDNWHKGLLYLVTHASRGDIVLKQYTPESRNYSALVPLVLSAFKKFDNIKYSEWSTDGLHKLIDPNLWQAMNVEFDVSSVTKEELLEVRKVGLAVKSGKKEGDNRNPVTTHKLYGLCAPYNKLPWLAQVMLFQIWVAHPANRTSLAVLDWADWDKIPEELIATTSIMPPKIKIATPRIVESDTLPWDV